MPNVLFAQTVPRPKTKRIHHFPLVVLVPLVAQPALRHIGVWVAEILRRVVGGVLADVDGSAPCDVMTRDAIAPCGHHTRKTGGRRGVNAQPLLQTSKEVLEMIHRVERNLSGRGERGANLGDKFVVDGGMLQEEEGGAA